MRDSCAKGRKEGEAECAPDDNQGNSVEKEVLDDVAVPCTVKNAGPLYDRLTVVGGNDDQETATSNGPRETQQGEETTEKNSTRNQQRVQELDQRIKALSPGFWGGKEPQDIGLRLILKSKRDALLKEDSARKTTAGESESTKSAQSAVPASQSASTISFTSHTAWHEESAFRRRQRVAEHESCAQALKEVEARLEALDPGSEARGDEFLGLREVLEKQREELKREVEWFEGLDWVEREK